MDNDSTTSTRHSIVYLHIYQQTIIDLAFNGWLYERKKKEIEITQLAYSEVVTLLFVSIFHDFSSIYSL
jgi:hypothetical protein